MNTPIVSADQMYEAHVVFCGGVSKVSGAKLPARLADCNPAVRESWFGQACFTTLLISGVGTSANTSHIERVPVPDGVHEADATEQRKRAVHQYWAQFGYYG